MKTTKKILVLCMAVVLATVSQAATFTLGYDAGDLGTDMIVDGALGSPGGSGELRQDDGLYGFVSEWTDIWHVSDPVNITGIALAAMRAPAPDDGTNTCGDGTWTLTFYELNGGPNADAWDGTNNGETVLTTRNVTFAHNGAGAPISVYALFDSPVSFTAQSTGIAVRLTSTNALRMRDSGTAPSGQQGNRRTRTSGDDQNIGIYWSLSGTPEAIIPPSLHSPTPSVTAVGVDLTTEMGWEVADATSPAYDINIGTTADCNDVLVGHSTGSSQSYTPSAGLLDYGTEYFWRVDVTDGGIEYQGLVWSFTTAPIKAGCPVPDSGETANRLTGVLTWCGGPLPYSYNVWFGTPGNLQLVGDYMHTRVSLDDLSEALGTDPLPAGDYQWRVDTRDASGALMATGDVWDVTIPAPLAPTAVARPNILYILSDDHGYSDVGANGWPDLEFSTPHIDTIFTSGVRFNAGYVSNAVCAPSRAGLITGREGSRFGFESNFTENTPGYLNLGLDTNQETLADVLKAAGYKTFVLGKWHLGNTPEQHPNQLGFDEWYGLIGGARTYFQRTEHDDYESLQHNSDWVTEPNGMYITDLLTDEGLAYITDHNDTNPDQPWFMYMSYTAPHGPMHAKQVDIDRVVAEYPGGFSGHFTSPYPSPYPYEVMDYSGVVTEYTTTDNNLLREIYAAMCVNMDDNIGRLLDLLDTLGIDDNTIVVFHSDNGGPMYGKNWSINLPLRGKKGELWEGGIRVPFAISWPGTIPSGQVFDANCPVSSLDLMPTFAAVSGADEVQDIVTDGVNLMPLLTNDADTTYPRRLYWRRGQMENTAMRSGDYKYLHKRNVQKEWLFNIVTGCEWDTCTNLMDIPAYAPIAENLIYGYFDWETTIPDVAFDAYNGSRLAVTAYALDDAVRGQSYSMPLTHSTPDGGSATWSIISGKPDWLSINPVTGELTGTPGPTAPRTNFILLQIDYAGETSTYKVPLYVVDKGDLTGDQKVDLEDVAELGMQWQSGYDIDTLLDIADNWLYGTSP